MERSFSSAGTRPSVMLVGAGTLEENATFAMEASVAGAAGRAAETSCGSHTFMLPLPRWAQAK